jgi:PucR C-terminal helix-turn-helix domain/GGDEF-like domain
MSSRPYESVPPEAADVLRPVLPDLADETVAAIAREVPDYAGAMEGEFGDVVRRGVVVAFNRFVELLGAEEPDAAGSRQTYVNLGRGEFRAGRSLDALLGAYRLGARLAWRRFVAAGVAGGLSAEALYALGEAIFAYIDELSAESVEGYAEEQSLAAGESDRRRRMLVRLLVQDPPAGNDAVRSAAAAAGWPLPRRLAVLVLATGDAGAADEALLDSLAARVARRLGEGAVGAEAGGDAVVLIPDPDAPGRRRRLEATIGGRTAALGPTAAWARAAASARRAAAAHRLAGAGRVPGGGLLIAEDHLVALLLAADPALGRELAERSLAPLDELAEGPRERLRETLHAWLDRPGQVQAVAAALDVHPQTVRYRIRQLRELFGERLEDPEGRFELALALRAG